LGDFSTYGPLFTLGSFLKISRVAKKFLATFFHVKRCVLLSTKMSWAIFHKLIWSPCCSNPLQEDRFSQVAQRPWRLRHLLPGISFIYISGANVITILRDFRQFSAKKFGVFLINQCYDQIFAKTSSSVSKKRQDFRRNFPPK
jgi:hypothetical protein